MRRNNDEHTSRSGQQLPRVCHLSGEEHNVEETRTHHALNLDVVSRPLNLFLRRFHHVGDNQVDNLAACGNAWGHGHKEKTKRTNYVTHFWSSQ